LEHEEFLCEIMSFCEDLNCNLDEVINNNVDSYMGDKSLGFLYCLIERYLVHFIGINNDNNNDILSKFIRLIFINLFSRFNEIDTDDNFGDKIFSIINEQINDVNYNSYNYNSYSKGYNYVVTMPMVNIFNFSELNIWINYLYSLDKK
jgi:hypothetical protein